VDADGRLVETRRAGRVAEGGVGCIGDVYVAVWVGFEAASAALDRVLGVQSAGFEHFGEKGGPGRVEGGQLGLECAAGVFGAAGEADEVAEVAVEFGGGEVWVGDGVEGIHIYEGKEGVSLVEALHWDMDM